MTITDAPTPARAADLPRRSTLIALWLAYAAIVLSFLGRPAITRVQEARVLETSRQMLAAPTWDGWLRPELNGEPRLRKPPLCYWYTAASYEVFGDAGEAAGRLPTALIALLTVAVAGAFGRDLLGPRGGFLAAAALATSSMFLRFARSAETDPPASLGVLLACWAIWRGGRPGGRALWMHLAALGIALAAMSKGGPAAFPVAFLILLSVATRSWRPIRRFVLSGAPLLAALLIAPWFVYVARSPGGEQVGQEVGVVLGGANHPGFFWEYAGPLAGALLPWSGWLIVGLIAALTTWRGRVDLAGRCALAVAACVALPLCVTRNVQAHYLLPIVPGCALLVAWWVDRATADDARAAFDARLVEATRWVLAVTALTFAIAPVGILIAGATSARGLASIDVVAALVTGAAAAWLIARHRRAAPARQHVALAGAMLVVMPLLAGHWAPSLKGEGLRAIAPEAHARMRRHLGAEPEAYLDVGDVGNVTLAYYLRRGMALTKDEAVVRRFAAAHPGGVVVVQRSVGKNRKGPPDPYLPGVLTKVWSVDYAESRLDFLAAR